MTGPGPSGTPVHPDLERLHAALIEATTAAGQAAYVVERTDHGLVVRPRPNEDVPVATRVEHEVRFPAPGTFSVTDHVRSTARWGGPRPGVRTSGAAGRIEGSRRRITFGRDADGRFRKLSDERHDTNPGRTLVETTATRLGLRQQRGWQERTAMVVAASTVAGLVVGGLVVLVALALGKF